MQNSPRYKVIAVTPQTTADELRRETYGWRNRELDVHKLPTSGPVWSYLVRRFDFGAKLTAECFRLGRLLVPMTLAAQ